jgi:hypothetical protein
MRAILAIVLAVSPLTVRAADDKPAAKPKPAEPVPGYQRHVIEGFNLLVHKDVLAHEDDKSFERKPLEVLELELKTIVRIMKDDAVKKLRTLVIWVEWDEEIKLGGGRAVAVYYGGSQAAMLGKGMHPGKANNVTVLSMKLLTTEHQPKTDSGRCVLLHEMAHAVHYHLVGYSNPAVKAAFAQAAERKLYEGQYARTNEHEYFAELTCAYLDRLHYEPHTRDDLKSYDPVGFKVMEAVWGKPKEVIQAEKAAKAEKAKADKEKAAEKAKATATSPSTTPGAEDDAARAERLARAAASKLKQGKQLLEAGQAAEARETLAELIKKYPGTPAAAEAAQLLDGQKK